jgi:hypothetical protein
MCRVPTIDDATEDDGVGACKTEGCTRSADFPRCRPCQRAWNAGHDHAQDRVEKRLQRLVRGGYDAE